MRKSPSNSSLHGQLTNEIQNGVSISRPTGYRLMQNGGASPPGEPFAVTYAYDANGNVSEYVSINGSIVAHYDYSPFGETLIESGDLASTFTHRFSTKPWCPVTGLCEYQMRKYRPEIGRWLSRDPLEGTPLICLVVNLLSRLRIAQIMQPQHLDDAKYSFILNNINLIHFADEDANGQDSSSDNQDDNQAGTGSRKAFLVLIFVLLGGFGNGAPSNSSYPGYSF